MLQLVARATLDSRHLIKLLSPTRSVDVETVQLHLCDRHDALVLEVHHRREPVGRDTLLKLCLDLGHDRRIASGVFQLRPRQLIRSPFRDLLGLVERSSEEKLHDVSQPMPPLALARRDQDTRKIRVVHAADLDAQVMSDPFGIELRVMCDLGLFI